MLSKSPSLTCTSVHVRPSGSTVCGLLGQLLCSLFDRIEVPCLCSCRCATQYNKWPLTPLGVSVGYNTHSIKHNNTAPLSFYPALIPKSSPPLLPAYLAFIAFNSKVPTLDLWENRTS